MYYVIGFWARTDIHVHRNKSYDHIIDQDLCFLCKRIERICRCQPALSPVVQLLPPFYHQKKVLSNQRRNESRRKGEHDPFIHIYIYLYINIFCMCNSQKYTLALLSAIGQRWRFYKFTASLLSFIDRFKIKKKFQILFQTYKQLIIVSLYRVLLFPTFSVIF